MFCRRRGRGNEIVARHFVFEKGAKAHCVFLVIELVIELLLIIGNW